MSAVKDQLEYKEYSDSVLDGIIYDIDDKYISREELDRTTAEYNQKHSLSDVDEKRLKAQKRKVRALTRRKTFEVFMTVGFITIVGVFVFLLLYPQQQLSEISRDNSDLKDEISILKRQVIDAEEAINGVNDVDAIRAQALALGMQDPNSNQVVVIPMPVDDKLVTVVQYDAYGISEDVYNNALSNLADYYLKHLTK